LDLALKSAKIKKDTLQIASIAIDVAHAVQGYNGVVSSSAVFDNLKLLSVHEDLLPPPATSLCINNTTKFGLKLFLTAGIFE
jgi:hypothetical protein